MTPINKLFFYLIIIMPLLDIGTSLSTTAGFSLSGGALVRSLLMLLLFVYVAFFVIKKRQTTYILVVGCAIASLCLMFIINALIKTPYSLVDELNFFLKTSYALILIFFVMTFIKQGKDISVTLSNALQIVSLIIGSTYWIAIITQTDLASYRYDKVGYSGWFYSANELSVVVLILISLSLVELHITQKIRYLFILSLLLSMLPMIGTKTAFLGGTFIITIYGLYLLFNTHSQTLKGVYKLAYFIIILLFFSLAQFTPINSNTTYYKPQNDSAIQMQSTPGFVNKFLSSRDIYFYTIADDFQHASLVRKLFGLGYAGDYDENPKVIEMDFFDLFFSYGYVGTFFILLPFMVLLYNLLPRKLSITRIILLLTLLMCIGVSFLAGHVLFAPSVMTYIALLLLSIHYIDKNTAIKNQKHSGETYEANSIS